MKHYSLPAKRDSSQNEIRRQIKEAFSRILSDMQDWQNEAIFLNAIWQRPGLTRGDYSARLNRLRAKVAQGRLDFEAAVAGLPDLARSNSRVLDMRRALARIEETWPSKHD